MGHWFSKKQPKSRVTQQDEAVLQLKTQRDKLKQYQRRIEVNLEKERELARTLLRNGKQDRAKLLLKKKRFQEQLIDRTLKQLDNIDTMIHEVEFAQIEVQVMDGLKAGNESLKIMHRLLSVEDVEQILDETREAVEYQQEIDRLVSGELTTEDLSELDEELDALIRENVPETKEQQPVPVLPEVPTEEPLAPAPQKERVKEKPKKAEPLPAT